MLYIHLGISVNQTSELKVRLACCANTCAYFALYYLGRTNISQHSLDVFLSSTKLA